MCGVAVHIITLLRHLSKEAFESHLVLLHDGHVGETARNAGIRPFIVGGDFPGDLRAVFRLARYIRRNGIDIVHTHTLNGNLYGRLSAMLARRAVIVTTIHTYMSDTLADIYENSLRRKLVIWQNRVTDRLASVLITPSEALKNKVVSEGIDPEKIHVVSNGIDIPVIQDSDQEFESVRKEFGISKDSFLLGTVGRMVPVKNLESLMEIVAQLFRDGLKLNLILIGDGPRREQLESLANSLGISQHVVFTGWRNDVLRILNGVDLYVHTSVSESFTYSIVEAMSIAKPVIAFDAGSLSEVISNGETGFLVTPRNNAAFKEAIAQMSINPDRAKQLGQAARKHTEDSLSAESMAEKIMTIYRSLV